MLHLQAILALHLSQPPSYLEIQTMTSSAYVIFPISCLQELEDC
jgi:hypothetical protein